MLLNIRFSFHVEESTRRQVHGGNREADDQFPSNTLEFLSKKHLNFGQGLDCLNFSQGNRRESEENLGSTQEKIRENEENQRQIDKTNRNRDSNFLLESFFLKLFCVCFKHVTHVLAWIVDRQAEKFGSRRIRFQEDPSRKTYH